MTIWVIRDKGRFHVQWDSNDPGWTYDKYLIRWDRDGKNLGQRDVSGTRGGSSNFDFTDPGSYTFIVEGRSGGGYHHGWTIPVGGVVRPGDFFQNAAPLVAAQCPAGTPIPYGLIGNTWVLNAVYWKLGCPREPEHDVPGRRGRLQTFANGQIAWTPDQGPKMTIWAIRNKAHFRVQWDTNDPTWSYDKYLIRWDRDGKNVGQRDISGTRNGWWDFDFTDPGAYTFIVEGRSGGYHHGWTIPVGGVVQPSDIPPPARVVPTPGPPVAANPRITVTYDAAKTLFTVNGSGFTPNHAVHIRVVNNANIQNPVTFQATSDGSGQLVNTPIQFPIAKPQTFSFSANDERQAPPSVDITGTLWSNTVTLTAT